MSEYEMIFMLSESVNRIWIILQVWIGITIGYMALAHLYGRNLDLVEVVAISCLFLLFTAALFGTISISFQAIEGYHAQLIELGTTKELAAGTRALLEAREGHIGARWLLPASAIFTFLCAFFYMPYIYFKTQRANT